MRQYYATVMEYSWNITPMLTVEIVYEAWRCLIESRGFAFIIILPHPINQCWGLDRLLTRDLEQHCIGGGGHLLSQIGQSAIFIYDCRQV